MHTKRHTLIGLVILMAAVALLATSEMLKTDAVLISTKWTKDYVHWTDVQNATTGPRGFLVKSNAEPETYGTARSARTFPSTGDVLLSFGYSGRGFLLVGFDDGSSDEEHATYGLILDNGKLEVRHGTSILTSSTTVVKDRFQIELQRGQGRIVYRKNGKVFFTVTEDTRKALRTKAFLVDYLSSFTNVVVGTTEPQAVTSSPTPTPTPTALTSPSPTPIPIPTPTASTSPTPTPTPTVSAVPTIVPTPSSAGGTIGGVELPRVYVDSTYPTLSSNRTVRSVKTSCSGVSNCFTDFQAALNAAVPGDEIVMDAGFTAVAPSGGFTLPNKNSTQWIVVRTANVSGIPTAGTRVSPSHSSQMPKILAGDNLAAIKTANGASHYRFVGVEISAANNVIENSGLVMLGSYSETNVANQAHHIIFDRAYVHGLPTKNTKRGFFLNSGHTAIVDSYLSAFQDNGADAQAILGDNGPGPLKVLNNYIEASGENLMIGGIDAVIVGMQMSDIEIRGNLFSKPLSWRNGPWVIKNLFELKNGQRILIDGNVFENSWAAAQSGMALNIKTANQDGGMTWAHTKDVTITNNVIRHAALGITVTDRDNNGPSGSTANVRVQNNVFDDISAARWGNGNGGTFLQSLGTTTNVTFSHNTAIHDGNSIVVDGSPAQGFVFKDNISFLSGYGIKGSGAASGNSTISTFFPGSTFTKNVLVGDGTNYPTNNFYPANASAVGFVNYNGGTGGDYRLGSASPYKNAASDGKDVGADIAAVDSATTCVVGGTCGGW